MPSLNDFIDPDLTSADVMHSSGYAQAASGGSIGSSSAGLSMEQRRKAANAPRTVGSYAHSHLGRRYGAAKARTADQSASRMYDASSDTFKDSASLGGNRQKGGLDRNKIDTSIAKRERFVEPPKRSHDPYA